MESLQSKIFKIMSSSPRGTIYINSDFNEFGTNTSIRKALTRLIDGYYTIPYFSELLKDIVTQVLINWQIKLRIDFPGQPVLVIYMF